MKKIFILFALLSLWSCHKDVPVLPVVEEPAKEQAKEDPEKKDPETPKQSGDSITSDEHDSALTREETLFRRLANAALRGQETCDVGDLNIKMEAKEGTLSESEELFAKFVKKYPFIFHIETDGSFSVVYKESDHSLVDKYRIESKVPMNQIREWANNVEKGMEECYASLAEGMSDVEIAYSVGYQITKRTSYSFADHPFDLLGPLVLGKAVCQGYSLAYCMLMENLGIRTDYIRGSSLYENLGHVWNRIFIEGQWYNMDLTWDDSGGSFPISDFVCKFAFTSDSRFYDELKHVRATEFPKIPAANSRRFENDNYFFRKNPNQTEAIYINKYWYYLSMTDMCIYKSYFDGSNRQTIYKLNRPAKEGYLWKQIAFGDKKIYFIDKFDNENYVCSVGYDGTGFEKNQRVTYGQLAMEGYRVKAQEGPYKKKDFGIVALRAEVALAKMKDAYYHGQEDYLVPKDPRRVEFVNTIKQAEKLLQSKSGNTSEATALCHKLRSIRKSYSMPLTYKA
ncbi:transglutaminase domain-containing protein [Porphyromonas pogonae]|uniref:transglutaminase domain-containing protein n=1 Tax=Porphyromonas pogonae TaxID=867595 RepID=UPI002E78F440|nr:transglutaminase domain-containing protein [Porphyromonas pogonae]